jgi:hypothetical protein
MTGIFRNFLQIPKKEVNGLVEPWLEIAGISSLVGMIVVFVIGGAFFFCLWWE